jgi:formylglycine-generating enzyme required for sulfatase activity
MGCVEGDTECEAKLERPHRVQVGGFWIGRTETTSLAYGECVAAGACPDVKERDATSPLCTLKNKQPKHPMNCVTYEEAKAFCTWIGGRLPTAEEWEFAAKGGEARRFPWGNEPLEAKRANFCDVNCPKVLPPRELKIPGRYDSTQDDHYVATSPVKAFTEGRSRWGLFDMAGNVREWTSNDLGGKTKDARGGSWSAREQRLRTSARYGVAPGKWETDVGFRCVQDK